jgi:diguanylate cyclase (GGDEF)-like protein
MSQCNKHLELPAEIEQQLGKCDSLPSLPSVVVRIIDASKDPDISLAEVANIISPDPALSAKLLKMANSPVYARAHQVTTLRDALSLLGLNASLTVALSFSLVSSLKSQTGDDESFRNFWKRSIISATAARQIGLVLNEKSLEEFFLASLLQDIGMLAVNCAQLTDPAENCTYKDSCNKSHFERVRCEKSLWGIDHSDIGAWLLKSWQLPEKLYQAVLCSHSKDCNVSSELSARKFAQCIWLSGVLSDIWLDQDRERIIEEHRHSVQQLLGMGQAAFYDFISQVDSQLPDMASLFDVTLLDEQSREQILNEARDILVEQNLKLILQSDQRKQEIESLQKQAENIEQEANRDHLTGTSNRKHIEEILATEFAVSKRRQRPLSLAFIDIDNFKPINDTFGHQSGDLVLQNIAQFFATNIRQQDSLARYGGDEFLLLLHNTNEENAYALLKRLMASLQSSPGIEVNEQLIRVTISIGMASFSPGDNLSGPEQLIERADKALYQSKKAGRDTISCYQKNAE